jgi:hypothetical protein
MSRKRVSYQNLLKQAISEFDTSKSVDVKGPMLDPILKWDGQGELPIYKDAASILERYYFEQEQDAGVEVSEGEYNEDGTEGKTSSEKHTKGTGTEQAGTSDAGNIPGEKKEAAKEIAKEAEDMSDEEDEEEEVEEAEWSGKDVPKSKKYVKEQDDDEEEDEEEEVEESEDLTEELENAVIEKLIAEMEDEDEDEGEEEEVEEGEMNYTGDGPKPGMEAQKEKKASGPEEDTKGAGTEQAGTGTDAGQVPDRKDNADKMVKPKNYNEQEEKDEEGEEEEELDVDKEMKKKEEVKEAGEAGHVPPPSMQKKMKGEDQGDDDIYEEAFKIFKEAIEEDE